MRKKQKFRLQRIENIECHYVVIDDDFPELTDLGKISDYFILEVENITQEDFGFFKSEYHDIFGEEPTDLSEKDEYYEFSTAGVSLNIIYQDDPVFGIRFNCDIRRGVIDVSDANVDVVAGFESCFENLSEKLKKYRK